LFRILAREQDSINPINPSTKKHSMYKITREHKFFMVGFLAGFFFYAGTFILGFYLRIKGIM
jgi:hypothetical protein